MQNLLNRDYVNISLIKRKNLSHKNMFHVIQKNFGKISQVSAIERYYCITPAFGLQPQCHVEKRFLKRFWQEQNRLNSTFNLSQGAKIQLNKRVQESRCKQDGTVVYSIQSTAHRLLASFAQDCESYCIALFLSRSCPRSHHFVVYTISILLIM